MRIENNLIRPRFRSRGIPAFGAVLLGLLLMLSAAHAQQSVPQDRSFVPTPGFRERVDFWIDIFTRYGKYQSVFHYRNHPQVIYSVLDFSDDEHRLSEREFLKKKQRAVQAEYNRIQGALRHLAQGNAPRNAAEKKIVHVFTKAGLNNPRYYREASDEKQIRSQTGIKERFRDGIVRSGRYLYAIEAIFRAEGLPEEIGRLPLVESSFDYEAYSSAGAAGIWQFMRGTGQSYMRINSAIDERRDPIISTRAAAKYLKHSHNKLGEWSLAVTSYNHGLSGVMRAVKETGSRDLETIVSRYKSQSFGFASSNFWCEFLAALEVERNSEKYFPGLKRESQLYFEEVQLGRPIFYRDLVRLSGTSDGEVYWLNRSFRDPIRKNQVRIPQSFLVKVPPGRAKVVLSSVPGSRVMPLVGSEVMKASIGEKKKADGTLHVVKKGETVGSIARKYGVSQWELMEANGIKDPRRLRLGRKLVVPGVYSRHDKIFSEPSKQAESSESRESSKSDLTVEFYTVKAGDTVGGIARKFGLSERELMSRNGLKDPKSLRIGKKLDVRRPTSASDKSQAPRGVSNYKVVPGDTLHGIAKKKGLPLKKLQQLNPQASSKIFPGQVLVLPE